MDRQQNFLLDKQPRERTTMRMMDNAALREKHTFSTKPRGWSTGRWLRAFVALAEGPGLAPSTHTVTHKHP